LDIVLNRLYRKSEPRIIQKVLLLSWIISLKLKKSRRESLTDSMKVYKESINPDILLQLLLQHNREDEAIWVSDQAVIPSNNT